MICACRIHRDPVYRHRSEKALGQAAGGKYDDEPVVDLGRGAGNNKKSEHRISKIYVRRQGPADAGKISSVGFIGGLPGRNIHGSKRARADVPRSACDDDAARSHDDRDALGVRPERGDGEEEGGEEPHRTTRQFRVIAPGVIEPLVLLQTL